MQINNICNKEKGTSEKTLKISLISCRKISYIKIYNQSIYVNFYLHFELLNHCF